MSNKRNIISVMAVLIIIIFSNNFSFGSGNELMITTNGIVDFQLDELGERRIQMYNEKGDIIKQTPALTVDSIIGRKNNLVLFTTRLAQGSYCTCLMDINTLEITLLTDGLCNYYYIDTKRIYLISSNSGEGKYQIFDLKGSKIQATNDINKSLMKNQKLFRKYIDKIDDPKVEGIKQKFEISELKNAVTISSDLVDTNNSKVYYNTDNIVDWTADNNYIYYVKPNNTKVGTQQTLIIYRVDRKTGATIQKLLKIRNCSGLQKYNDKLIFSGYGYSDGASQENDFNHAIFTIDCELKNLTLFGK